jgi:hypothetical protein
MSRMILPTVLRYLDGYRDSQPTSHAAAYRQNDPSQKLKLPLGFTEPEELMLALFLLLSGRNPDMILAPFRSRTLDVMLR